MTDAAPPQRHTGSPPPCKAGQPVARWLVRCASSATSLVYSGMREPPNARWPDATGIGVSVNYAPLFTRDFDRAPRCSRWLCQPARSIDLGCSRVSSLGIDSLRFIRRRLRASSGNERSGCAERLQARSRSRDDCLQAPTFIKRIGGTSRHHRFPKRWSLARGSCCSPSSRALRPRGCLCDKVVRRSDRCCSASCS